MIWFDHSLNSYAAFWLLQSVSWTKRKKGAWRHIQTVWFHRGSNRHASLTTGNMYLHVPFVKGPETSSLWKLLPVVWVGEKNWHVQSFAARTTFDYFFANFKTKQQKWIQLYETIILICQISELIVSLGWVFTPSIAAWKIVLNVPKKKKN